MPITPLHGLAILFLYFKDKRRIDPLALMVSATFIDLEPLYYLLIGETSGHRIWHGFALVLTIYPVLVTIGVYLVEYFFKGRLWSVYEAVRLKPTKVQYPLLSIYLCSLFGGFSHIFFDMFTHKNMPYVIYPLVYGNPFYSVQASVIVEIAVVLLSIYSCALWLKQRTSS
jgi:hypothetical protein